MLITRRSMLVGIAGAAFASVLSHPEAEAKMFGAYDVSDQILELWLLNQAAVGLPTSAEYAVSGGRKQRFANADMYYSPAAGASIIFGKIKSTFDAANGAAALGLPLGKESSSSTYSARSQACLSGRVWWSASDGGKAVPAGKTVRLKGAKNFRDVAGEGSGIAVAGGRMRRNMVFRSSGLGAISKMDRYILQTLGVRTTIALSGATLPSIPGISRVRYGIVNGSARTLAEKQRMYRNYVANSANRKSVGNALNLIADTDKPVVFQCLKGWDRSGWVAAVLQDVLGASSSDIRAEFLKSNQYNGPGVKREYLDAALGEMKSRYGSVERYVSACGVDSAARSMLRKKLID
ncbi:MAG: tyrosine-protein phosphatase [Propionicimonas sp.]